MELGEGVEWALHCCAVLATLPDGRTLPAARLAEFHGVPGAYLAKHLQALSQAGVLEAVPGRRGGYRLGRPPADITLLEIVEAVQGETGTFRCTEIRRRGPSAAPLREYRHDCTIAVAMYRADAAWRAELQRQTLATLLGELAPSISPVVVRRAAAWIQEVAR
ncbi:MAG TPA: Rrf2 family transcriptional regulator [Acidimicrobiales bacterium]